MAERIAKLADKTATQTKSATTTAVEASKIGLARAAEIGRESVLPEIERTGSQAQGAHPPRAAEAGLQEYLFWLHERVLDPPIETLFFKPTKDPVPLAGLTIRGNNREHGHDYRPTPCALFDWTVGGHQLRFVAAHFRRLRRGQGTRAAARLTASLPCCRRHRVRRGAA